MSWFLTSFLPGLVTCLSVYPSVYSSVTSLSPSRGVLYPWSQRHPVPIYWLFQPQPLKFVWKACNAVHFRWSVLICDQTGIHWRREWQTIPVYLLWELHELYKRPKRWVPQVSSMLLGKIEGELPIAPEWMAGPKRILCSVMDMSGDESKIWRCKEHIA